MAGSMSIGGLASGLDVESIVTKLMEYAQTPLTRLQEQKALNQQKLTAWQDINTRILALQASSQAIADAADFRRSSATSSDTDVVTATATTDASPGTYYMTVMARAQAHQVSSQAGGFTSTDDTLGTGTVHIGLESGTNLDITLDASNNTLAGLRDAINKAQKGVQATILNAGSSANPDYRMMLTSTQTGTVNQMAVIDTSGLTGGKTLAFGHVSSQAGGYTSETSAVGTGTVHFARQDGTSFDITLDAEHNTLAGLRDAINSAGQGIQASITNAGTEASPDYRLELNATKSGADNQLVSIDTSGLSGGTQPVFDQDNPMQAAADATVKLGLGTGQITVTKSTNTITDLITGVTLNLLDEDPGSNVRIDVARDTDSVTTAIQNFVTQYNDVSDAISSQMEYDVATGTTPPLFGDYLLQAVQSDLVSTITNPVAGLPKGFNAIASLGITQDTTGHLNINTTTLNAALTDHVDDVAKMFSASAESSNAFVSYLASSSETKQSDAAGWQVNITQAATRGSLTSGVEMASPLGANETLTVNGKTVSLTAGMTIDQVIERINSQSSTTYVTAMKTGIDGTGEGNYLTFQSTRYGSGYEISIVSNTSSESGTSTGVGNKTMTMTDATGQSGNGRKTAGLDVAGTINGEVATGAGQILSLRSLTSTNAAKGLSLLITSTGPLEGVKINFTKGIGASLRDLLATATSTTGVVTQAEDSITAAMSQLDTDMADMQTKLAAQEQKIRDQFNSMESQLSKLQSQGNYLTAQFSAMNQSD